MTPVPNRGKRNEPKNVKFVAEKISEIKSISINEVIQMTTRTAKKLFNLSILTLMFLMAFSISQAQKVKAVEVETIEDEEIPYEKFLGIGLMFGGNTVVETYLLPTKQERDISYDGLMTFGGALFYGVFDYLIVEAGYNYSKNTKIVKEQAGLVAPSIYQTLEFSSHWIINPYSRINFYGSIGLNYYMNSFNNVPNKQLGWNTGVGFFINLPTDFGLFNFVAEWRINFETENKPQIYSDRNYPQGITLQTSSFYSIPRAYIVYYPPLR
jgi:hypothetical protein